RRSLRCAGDGARAVPRSHRSIRAAPASARWRRARDGARGDPERAAADAGVRAALEARLARDLRCIMSRLIFEDEATDLLTGIAMQLLSEGQNTGFCLLQDVAQWR